MSDNEANNTFEAIEEDDQNEEKPPETLPKRKLGKGSDFLHILPAKFNNYESSFKAPVDSFFETRIKEENPETNKCTSRLRGRLLNGQKVNSEKSKVYMNYLELLKVDSNSYQINQEREIKDFYVWKFDEPLRYKEPLTDLEDVFTKLQALE